MGNTLTSRMPIEFRKQWHVNKEDDNAARIADRSERLESEIYQDVMDMVISDTLPQGHSVDTPRKVSETYSDEKGAGEKALTYIPAKITIENDQLVAEPGGVVHYHDTKKSVYDAEKQETTTDTITYDSKNPESATIKSIYTDYTDSLLGDRTSIQTYQLNSNGSITYSDTSNYFEEGILNRKPKDELTVCSVYSDALALTQQEQNENARP
jgi:hypothetical protein